MEATALALVGLRLFFALLLAALASSPDDPPSRLFLATRGRSHRLAGAAHLSWLLLGVAYLVHPPCDDDEDNRIGGANVWVYKCLAYDIVLGILGVAATLTAAKDFPHKRVINRPGESGTLAKEAMVTQGEMVEHAFYQGLNLWQAVYLHAITWLGGNTMRTTAAGRMALLWVATLPWAARGRFPLHSFSANWTGEKHAGQGNAGVNVRVGKEVGEKGLSSINRMYQIKKWQYVFYKHVILHGLNISMAVPRASSSYDNYSHPLPLTLEWRVFWISLNASYVMEFFLQSLVKRRILGQRHMMLLNALLMASATAAAAGAVLGRVRAEAAIVSLLLNFANRRHDIANTMATGCLVACIR